AVHENTRTAEHEPHVDGTKRTKHFTDGFGVHTTPSTSVCCDASRIGRSELYRLAAAAGRGLVRIVEHEGRGELVDLEIHLGAEQEHDRLGIDEQLDALVLDDFVE